MAERAPQGRPHPYFHCRYCGGPETRTGSGVCREHADLPGREPLDQLARNAGFEELESSPHRSNPRKETHHDS